MPIHWGFAGAALIIGADTGTVALIDTDRIGILSGAPEISTVETGHKQADFDAWMAEQAAEQLDAGEDDFWN